MVDGVGDAAEKGLTGSTSRLALTSVSPASTVKTRDSSTVPTQCKRHKQGLRHCRRHKHLEFGQGAQEIIGGGGSVGWLVQSVAGQARMRNVHDRNGGQSYTDLTRSHAVGQAKSADSSSTSAYTCKKCRAVCSLRSSGDGGRPLGAAQPATAGRAGVQASWSHKRQGHGTTPRPVRGTTAPNTHTHTP